MFKMLKEEIKPIQLKIHEDNDSTNYTTQIVLGYTI